MKITDYFVMLKVDDNKKFSLMIIFKNDISYKEITNVNKVFNKLYIIKNDIKYLLELSNEINKYLVVIKECFITNEIEYNNKGEALLFNI
jgi:hypothetical protein